MSKGFHTQKSVSSNIRSGTPLGTKRSGKDIAGQLATGQIESWINDTIGSGIKNTQQLLLDWSKWENHVFFNSAEAKTNLAFDQITNKYPFDGTSVEKLEFMTSIDGFTKHVLTRVDSSFNFANFTGTQYLEVVDSTGFLVPDLSRVKLGQSKLTRGIDETGTTVEFWIKLDVNSTDQIVLQKINGTEKGLTIYVTDTNGQKSINYLLSSDQHRSISVSTEVATGEWTHITFVYYRSTTEKVAVYKNGEFEKITTDQAELLDITLGLENLYIGAGSEHTVLAGSIVPSSYLIASLDELRIWNVARTSEAINKYYQSNIDQDDNTQLYYRFNEPYEVDGVPQNYSGLSVILDYSGNSFHTTISVGAGVYETELINFRNNLSSDLPPIVEIDDDNKVLFPDWPNNVSLNSELVQSANSYDRNNPNLITKLVPRHYFEEAQYFEGIERNMEEPEGMGLNNNEFHMPGHNKLPPSTVIYAFLMVWAQYFDDIKLYIDAFSTLDKVKYTGKDQIPPILLDFLMKYYKVNMGNAFNTESLDKYILGKNIINDSSEMSGSLKDLMDGLWRRVLVNMPFLTRSRGTIGGIKAFMNSVGIEPNSFFRLKEYGGVANRDLVSLQRVSRKEKIVALDFSDGIDWVQSSQLKAWRHEPGAPDPLNGPTVSTVDFISGDFALVDTSGAPTETTFLSGSWGFETHIQLDSSVHEQSIFSIINDNGIVLANCTATLDTDGIDPSYTVNFHTTGHLTNTVVQTVTIENMNLWDGNYWYLSAGEHWLADKRGMYLRICKAGTSGIIEFSETYNEYDRDNTALASDLLATDPSVPSRFYISEPSNITPTGDILSEPDNTLSFSGRAHHMRFWTKAITASESREHCLNPFSIWGTELHHSNVYPILDENGTKLWEVPTETTVKVYPDSWERCRMHFDMLQPSWDFTPGYSELIDASQNDLHLTVHGDESGLKAKELLFSVLTPDYDAITSENKIRIRSWQSEDNAILNGGHYGNLYDLPEEVGIDDRRFGIESSVVAALNSDMMNLLGNMERLNNYLGAPEMDFAVEYPELRKIREIYFQRLVGTMDYNRVIEFQRWFNNSFGDLIESFVPYTAQWLGVNFVVESHILERHKYEYKYGDIHVDVKDRQAITVQPIIIGTVRNEIT